MPNRNYAGASHGDGGSPSCSANAPVQYIDEQRIKDNVEDGSSSQNPHRFGRVARGTNQAGEVESHRCHEHTWQHNIHIFTCVGDGIGRGTEHGQDFVHEEIATRDKKETEEEGQQHAVA